MDTRDHEAAPGETSPSRAASPGQTATTARREIVRPDTGPRHGILITGYPGFIAQFMARKLLEDPRNDLYLLCVQSMLEKAQAARDALGEARDRAEILVGDITVDTLGLDFRHRYSLAQRVQTVYHLAAIYHLGTPYQIAHDVNVTGTRNVLDFAAGLNECRRLVYFSTAYVAGRRTGVVREDECHVGQGFKNHYEATKCQAEEEVLKRRDSIPCTIIRPGIVVGHSRTGEIPKYDGPYYTIRAFVAFERHGKRGRAKLFSIGGRDVPLYLVPVDFIVDATHFLATSERGLGAFHVLPSNPITVQELLDFLFERFGVKRPWYRFPPWLMRLCFRLPGVAAMFQTPRQSLDYLDHDLRYDTKRLDEALAGSGLSCPHPRDYLDVMIAYVREHPKIPPVL